jgi:hypothetical protein
MSRNPRVMDELRQARREDLAGKFKVLKLQHPSRGGKYSIARKSIGIFDSQVCAVLGG